MQSWSFVDAATISAMPEVKPFLTAMERLRGLDQQPGWWWVGPGELTCDAGALMCALVARRLNIPVRLCAGLYWHTDPRLRAEMMGEHQGDDTSEDWAGRLRRIEADMMDEHHHWVVLWPDREQGVLVDQNGPVRDEAVTQLVTAALGGGQARAAEPARYDELPADDPWRAAMYDPDDDWDELLDEMYPGLRSTLDMLVG